MTMGQIEQMKMVQMAAGLAPLNTSRPIGSQASGETGLSRLISGEKARLAKSKRPMMKPSGMPTAAAILKPMATRLSDDRMFQPMPWSFGPFW